MTRYFLAIQAISSVTILPLLLMLIHLATGGRIFQLSSFEFGIIVGAAGINISNILHLRNAKNYWWFD